jgi:hypothetical protein
MSRTGVVIYDFELNKKAGDFEAGGRRQPRYDIHPGASPQADAWRLRLTLFSSPVLQPQPLTLVRNDEGSKGVKGTVWSKGDSLVLANFQVQAQQPSRQ